MKTILISLCLLLSAVTLQAQDLQDRPFVSYKNAEQFRNLNPDTSFVVSGRLQYKIYEGFDGGCRLVLLNDAFRLKYKPDEIYLVQVGDKKFRAMPRKQYATTVHENGLVLYRRKDYIFPALHLNYFWFSDGLDQAAHKLNRRQLRKVFSDKPDFLAAVEAEFGKTGIPLFSRRLYQTSWRNSSTYVIGELYQKHVLGKK